MPNGKAICEEEEKEESHGEDPTLQRTGRYEALTRTCKDFSQMQDSASFTLKVTPGAPRKNPVSPLGGVLKKVMNSDVRNGHNCFTFYCRIKYSRTSVA